MEGDFFIGVAQQALWILALASAPILIPALIAGLILGMIQAATSINEQTLTFVPKLIVVAICRRMKSVGPNTALSAASHFRCASRHWAR